MSGFRIVRISDVRVVVNRPDFRRPIDLETSEIRTTCPDFERSGNCIDKPVPKPVPNLFGTGFGLQTGLEPV